MLFGGHLLLHQSNARGLGADFILGFLPHREPYHRLMLLAHEGGQDSPPPQTFQKHTPKPALARSQDNSIIHPDSWEGKAGSEISSGWTVQVLLPLDQLQARAARDRCADSASQALRMPWSSLQDWCSPGTKHLPKRINFLNSCMVAETKSSTVFFNLLFFKP